MVNDCSTLLLTLTSPRVVTAASASVEAASITPGAAAACDAAGVGFGAVQLRAKCHSTHSSHKADEAHRIQFFTICLGDKAFQQLACLNQFQHKFAQSVLSPCRWCSCQLLLVPQLLWLT